VTATGAPGLPVTLVGAASEPRPRATTARLGRLTVGLLLFGILLTSAVTWAAARAHDGNEDRLLQRQAEEATAVLQQAVPTITSRAQALARIAGVLQDDPQRLSQELALDVGEGAAFTTVTAVRGAEVIASVGTPAALQGEALRRATGDVDAEQVHITDLLDPEDPRLAYTARSATSPEVVVHAEQQLAVDRINPTQEGSAFDGIEVALYLGDAEDADRLLLASTPDLPLDGRRAVRQIPLGDATMRFVVSPAGTLGGALLRAFPWIVLAAGIAATATGCVLVETLQRRRRDAEAFTDEVRALYRREHAIAHTLQHSLLPTHLDRLDGIEVAARYFAGAEGAEIGGDWYDVIAHPDRFTVVVGDVVGRGVQAAAVMAAMRYGTHAVAGQDTDPGQVLQAVNGLEHIRGDFVTMLCGTVEPATGTACFASAGHPPPLLIDDDGARFMPLEPGPPIGFIDGASYGATCTALPHRAVLVLFTDGLFERPGESIELGLERLRAAAAALIGRPVGEVLDGLAAAMLGDGVRDDTAMLAVRLP